MNNNFQEYNEKEYNNVEKKEKKKEGKKGGTAVFKFPRNFWKFLHFRFWLIGDSLMITDMTF